MADNAETYRDTNHSHWQHFKSWENPFVGKKTCTANIWDIQQALIK